MTQASSLPPYPTFGEWASERYGGRIRKIMVNAGFTCPNRDGTKSTGGCIYCDNAAFSPLLDGTILEQAHAQIHAMKHKPHGIIVYFQPFSNTYGPPKKLLEKYLQALKVPGLAAIAIGTRPDCIDKGVINILDELAKRVDVFLEIGVQSAHDRTLQRINRGHTWDDTRLAFELAAEKPNILTVAHLIIGLPDETIDDMLDTADMVNALSPHGIKLHHLHVVKNTKLADEYAAGRVKMLDADKYVSIAVDFIRQFDAKTVLHRLMGETMGDALIAPKLTKAKHEIVSEILAQIRN